MTPIDTLLGLLGPSQGLAERADLVFAAFFVLAGPGLTVAGTATASLRLCVAVALGAVALAFRMGGLGPQKLTIDRGAVEAADDGVHLLVIGGFDESVALGFLGLEVPDDADGVTYQVTALKP